MLVLNVKVPAVTKEPTREEDAAGGWRMLEFVVVVEGGRERGLERYGLAGGSEREKNMTEYGLANY